MEKEISKGLTLILPFLYDLRRLRQRYPFVTYLVFGVELTMLLAIPIDYSEPVADNVLMTIIDFYDQYLLENETILVLSSLFFITFMILVLLACLTEYLQSKVRKSSKLLTMIDKFKQFLLYSFIGCELIIMPGFIMTAKNVLTGFVPGFKIISFLLLPFTILAIAVGGNKRLFGWYSILITISHIFLDGIWTPLLMLFISSKLGLAQAKETHKKIVYLLFAVWCVIIIAATVLNQQIDSFYLLITMIVVAAIIAFDPNIQEFSSYIEENQYLIFMTESVIQGKELSTSEKQLISHCIFRVKEDFINTDKGRIQSEEKEWLANFEFNNEKQQIIDFLAKKIELELRRQHSYCLKMQEIECQIKFSRFNMKTLYELEKLISDIKIESTYEEKEKMFQLVSLANNKFLKKDENINAGTVIAVEGYTEELYEYFINIAVIMQELWILHGKNSLNDQNIYEILEKVIQIQEKAEEIMQNISRHSNMKHELAILDFLKKMVNNGYKIKQQIQFQKSKEDLHNSEYSSYILIQQGNILKMSNRLLNQCQLTKSQAEGYRINDIFNQPIADYLYKRLDRILEQQNLQEETNFILPLKVSREHNYIQPYRSTIEILPQLINGIKYILHFAKTPDIQKVPFLLYSGKTDTIISITKNFKSYFNIQNDHYIFNSYISEVFNADIMAMIQSQDNDFNEIMCEFKVKKKNSNSDLKQKVIEIPVKLKKIKYYNVKNENIVLLSIVKREEIEKADRISLKSEELPFMNTKERTSKEKANNSITFCKIPNPYENLIDQKVSKMKEFSRMSYQKIIIILMSCLLLTLVIFIIVFTVKIDKMSDKIMQNYNNQILKSDKQINNLVLYSQSSILYMVRKYPNHLLKISPSYSISALVSDYVKKISKGITTILTQEVNNQIFAYSTQSSQKSIYDILQDAKKGMATQDIRDLVFSWSYMKNIVFQESNSSNDNLDSLINFLFYFGNATMAFFAVIIVSLEIVSYKIQQISNRILCLYEKIDHTHSYQFAQKFRQFIHVIYCSRQFRGVKANKYLQQYKTKTSFQKIEEVDTLCYLQESIGFQINQNQSLDKSISIDKPSIKRQGVFSFVYKQLYIFLLLILLVSFLQIFLYTLKSYKSQFQDILSHEIDLHNIRNNISFGTSFFMISSLQEILPVNSRLSPISNKVLNISTDISTQLPDYFSAYLKNESYFLNTNLCNLNLTNEIIYQGIICSQILEGIMQIGLAETIILHNQLINKYSFTNMSQFSNTFRPHSKYPVFMEVLYIRRAVYNLITSLQSTFLGYAFNYVGIQNSRLQSFIKLAWILFPVLLCISVCFFMSKRWKCSVCLKSFFVIPKEYLLEMSVTKVLRKQDILSHIENLAF